MNKRDLTAVIEPLEKIGAFFYPQNKKTLPITIEGTNMPLAQKHIENRGSAQINRGRPATHDSSSAPGR